MPFKSERQRAFMHANHPEIAKRWEEDTPPDVSLPKKVEPKATTPGAKDHFTRNKEGRLY